jgi:DNA (cytosine-5)-methyltransferase 1
MGYKLAGFDVIGGVEIDPAMMSVYRANHRPKHSYLMGVQEFKNIPNEDLPEELFNLDILDGSPPCSSFSMSGDREKKWGKASKFREGQAVQNLDDLFFEFIDVAKKLGPKVVVAENVKGLLHGNARGYVQMIFKAFRAAGYDCQLFLLNSSRMGVPQTRERTFFVANKIQKRLKLEFNEPVITVNVALEGLPDQSQLGRPLTKMTYDLWKKCLPGESLSVAHERGSRFNTTKVNPNMPAKTLTSQADANPMHWNEPRRFTMIENSRIQTFPDDFNFLKFKGNYIQGMSVPPFMMQRVANEILKQFFNS